MVRINLLPIRQIRRRQNAVHELFIFLLSLVVVLAGIGVAWGALAHTISSLNQDIRQLQVKKDSYNAILKQIEELKKQKNSLETKIDTIKKLKKGSQVAVRILDEIATRTPSNRMWLKSFKQSATGLSLAGVALDNATIAQYMNELVASPMFTAADLVGSSQTQVAGQKLKSFTLNIAVKPTTAAEEPNKDQVPGNKK